VSLKRLGFMFLVLLAVNLRAAELVDIIPQIECPHGWDGRPGAAGELTEYQITPSVWHQHEGNAPFSLILEPGRARACALKHLRWLVAGLERNGIHATPERIYTAWNIGLQATLRRQGRPTDYGRRAANLYYAAP
jgi:hypothetical protein